jgi:hypothetical protein
MTEYFDSSDFRKDFNNLLKSIILISQKLDNVSTELSNLNFLIEKIVERNNTDE